MEDVTSRHNDLMKLEKSIRDLNELFKELGQHVEFQVSMKNTCKNCKNMHESFIPFLHFQGLHD
jgi:t-SNARE complex subunit (syntaxin)